MQASFVLDSSELDHSFIDKVKSMFQNKKIELYISDIDDTEYLSASQTNKDKLLQSISNVQSNKNTVIADSKIFE